MQTLPQIHASIVQSQGREEGIGQDKQVETGKAKSGELAVKLEFHHEA